MFYDETIWLDFAGSLAIIFVLTIAYGNIARLSFPREIGRMLLGLGFGFAAWLQMHMPLEPMEGLIIDLRNVPLVLCGAFLGWRASIICFTVAAATRYGIGGIGMWSGILAMVISLAVGATWAHLTRKIEHRKLKHMVLLSVFASLNLSGVVVLAEPARTWFLSNASLPIAVFNLVSITLAARLIDGEEHRISREIRLAASAICNPDHGALLKPAFEREIALRVSAGTMFPPSGLLVIQLRYVDTLFSIIPSAWKDRVLGLIRTRVLEVFDNSDLNCAITSTALAFPLSQQQFANSGELQMNIRRLMSSEPFMISRNVVRLLSVETKVYDWEIGVPLDGVLQTRRSKGLGHDTVSLARVNSEMRVAIGGKKASKKQSTISLNLTNSTTEGLFGKAAFLMNAERLR